MPTIFRGRSAAIRSASFLKEIAQLTTGARSIVIQLRYVWKVVQSRRTLAMQIQQTTQSRPLFRRRQEVHGAQSGMDNGAGTHQAGFQAGDQAHFAQSLVADCLGCGLNGQQFGMRSGIATFDNPVPLGGDDAQFFRRGDQTDGADGSLASLRRLRGQRQTLLRCRLKQRRQRFAQSPRPPPAMISRMISEVPA